MSSSKDIARVLDKVETLLDQPCWVIDILPSQVPADSPGRFSVIEQWWLESSHAAGLRGRFVDVLLRLNCFHDFVAVRDGGDEVAKDPSPKRLTKWIMRDKGTVNIILWDEDALVSIPSQSTCMSVHGASPELLEQVRLIANGCGLFAWQPAAEDSE